MEAWLGMAISVSSSFAFEFDHPGDALLQFEAAALPEQRIVEAETRFSDTEHCARIAVKTLCTLFHK